MPRVLEESAQPIYAAAERCIDAGFRNSDSVFSPGKSIWTKQVLDDLHERFVGNPDLSSDTFDTKLERQLRDAPDETIQLAAEILYLHLLMPLNVKGDTKRALINKVLGWAKKPVSIPEDLDAALNSGIASTGMAFLTYRPYQIQFLIEFLQGLKTLDVEGQTKTLDDPWAFKELASRSAVKASQAQQAALLHLAFPETFESLVSRRAKERIAESYADRVTSPTGDLDRKLAQIRGALTEEHGKNFNFYDPEIITRWQRDPSKWSQLIHWASKFHEAPDFYEKEYGYKLQVVDNIREAREAIRSEDDDWFTKLKRAFGPPNNIANHHSFARLFDWCESDPDSARAALEGLFESPSSVGEKVAAFSQAFPEDLLSGPGVRLNLISFLLMGVDHTEFPPYMYTPFKDGYALVNYPKSPQIKGISGQEALVYEHALRFLDDMAEEAESRGLTFTDRMDAQGMLWAVTQWEPRNLDFLTPEERRAFLKFRGDDPVDEEEEDPPEDKPKVVQEHEEHPYDPASLDELAKQVFIDRAHLKEIAELLDSKGQVIFYGPPGTGKTFVALKLADYLTREGGSVGKVQFHPSYAYEDFVEGYRPALHDDGQPGFKRKPGPLLRAAKRASESPEITHVLIIDEINRGNIAKIFGELYFLLEYRDAEIQLQYSENPFELPSNLKIIGTMNTADRSIALVDLALRRRFHFCPFFPDEAPIKGLLRRWLNANNKDLLWVAELIDLVNTKLPDRETAVGPSHFMEKNLTEARLEKIWRYSVLPYIAEQFYGETDRLQEFALDRLKKELAGEVLVADDARDDEDGSGGGVGGEVVDDEPLDTGEPASEN